MVGGVYRGGMTVDLTAWRTAFAETLRPRLAAALDALASAVPAADIVGLGVYSDSDAGSIIPAVNTRAHRDELVLGDPDWAEDYTWSIGEWDRTPFDHPEATQLDALSDELERVGREARDEDGQAGLEAFRRAAWSAVADAMAQLFEAGWFDRWPDAVQVFIPADGVVAETQLADWNERCNTAQDAARFRAWVVVD